MINKLNSYMFLIYENSSRSKCYKKIIQHKNSTNTYHKKNSGNARTIVHDVIFDITGNSSNPLTVVQDMYHRNLQLIIPMIRSDRLHSNLLKHKRIQAVISYLEFGTGIYIPIPNL